MDSCSDPGVACSKLQYNVYRYFSKKYKRYWTYQEDAALIDVVEQLQQANQKLCWSHVAKMVAKQTGAPLRPASQVSQRHRRVLARENEEPLTSQESFVLIQLCRQHSNQWALIARELAAITHTVPRTDCQIKYLVYHLGL